MPAEPTYVPRMSPPALLTADELQHVYVPDKQVELVRGLLVVREPRRGRRSARLLVPRRGDFLDPSLARVPRARHARSFASRAFRAVACQILRSRAFRAVAQDDSAGRVRKLGKGGWFPTLPPR